MDLKRYKNFVKSTSVSNFGRNSLSGDEAKRIYLQEISKQQQTVHVTLNSESSKKKKVPQINYDDKELLIAAQNNNSKVIKDILEMHPNKVDVTDEYGWSLLMIACQANALETVKELLKYNADTSIRDKAGNSAQSLVIKNRNLALADLLLGKTKDNKIVEKKNFKKSKRKSEYTCEICNNEVFSDKNEHLSSTIHNINASKSVKIRSAYKIPQTNKGYQIMLKGGWDRHSGLGPDGSGRMYPIRTSQKLDKKGLGLEKTKLQKTENISIMNQIREYKKTDCNKNRRMEINFRREFY